MAEQALTKLDHRNEKKMLLLALEVLFVKEVWSAPNSGLQWTLCSRSWSRLPCLSVAFWWLLAVIKCDCHPSKAMTSFACFVDKFCVVPSGAFCSNDWWSRSNRSSAHGDVQLMPLQLSRYWQFWKQSALSSWADLDDPCVMRVFGTRKAELKVRKPHSASTRVWNYI